jgi:hypothetical protein
MHAASPLTWPPPSLPGVTMPLPPCPPPGTMPPPVVWVPPVVAEAPGPAPVMKLLRPLLESLHPSKAKRAMPKWIWSFVMEDSRAWR